MCSAGTDRALFMFEVIWGETKPLVSALMCEEAYRI